MLSSDLQGKRVRRENGEALGRVDEIHVEGSRVSALTCGRRGWLQRLTGSRAGHRIGWEQVVAVTPSEVVVADEAPSRPRPRRAAGRR